MAPTSDQPGGAPKKSLRIWVRNNGHVMRKKTCARYVYPRTVEAAKDPFECGSGKNKMFFLIAINLFPDSKIVRPDDTDSETEMEATTQCDSKSGISTEEPVPKTEVTPTKKGKKNKASSSSPPPSTTLTLQKVSESLKSQTNVNKNVSKNSDGQDVPVATPAKRKISKSKSSSPKVRSPPAKKLRTRSASSSNVENKEECSKATKMMITDDGLSTLNGEKLQPNQTNKIKAPDVAAPRAPLVYARKSLPSAIPTIMNSFNKVIQNCSTTGVVSFSLAKKPRQSRS